MNESEPNITQMRLPELLKRGVAFASEWTVIGGAAEIIGRQAFNVEGAGSYVGLYGMALNGFFGAPRPSKLALSLAVRIFEGNNKK